MKVNQMWYRLRFADRVIQYDGSMKTSVALRTRAASRDPGPSLVRRRLLRAATAVIAAPMLTLPRRAFASLAPARTLAFDHVHTGETLSVTYAEGGAYVPDALGLVNGFLRDFRNGEIHVIDPALLDQLYLLATVSGTRAPFQVISAYRSPVSNQMLREHGHGVASHSLHMQGQAIDIRLADVALSDLRDAALSLRAGGVGFYPGSNFIHVDTGRVRRW